MIRRLGVAADVWDVIVIGGGATGLGVAVDASSRGYRTLLLERGDLAVGTSSRSTKLVHGGVRYLQQGNLSLVVESLRERGLLHQNATHLVTNLRFVVPNYEWWEAPFYGVGLKLYDLMAGKLGFGPSRLLSKEETIKRLPTIETEGLRGGIIYHDGQFDDARLAVNLAQTAVEQGATVINYAEVTALSKENALVNGVTAIDRETGRSVEIRGRVVINATGAFADSIRHLDDPRAPRIIQPSQGVHIVLDKPFLPGEDAIMVPHTSDGRIIFMIPWYGRVVVGTTDTAIEAAVPEPTPTPQEIDFLLETSARFLTHDPTRSDIRAVFVGIRPLVRGVGEGDTAALSREHTIAVSQSGLVTIAGGKWTTYRKMAEDTVDVAADLAQLPQRPCATKELRIHGHTIASGRGTRFAEYGSDAPELVDWIQSDPALAEPIRPEFDACVAQVVWAARNEMARTVDDVLCRRTRAVFLDIEASLAAAPRVAEILARELGRNEDWARDQVRRFQDLVAPLNLR